MVVGNCLSEIDMPCEQQLLKGKKSNICTVHRTSDLIQIHFFQDFSDIWI